MIFYLKQGIKTALCLKSGVLLDLQISNCGCKEFFPLGICEKGMFSNLGTSVDVCFGRELVGVGWGLLSDVRDLALNT